MKFRLYPTPQQEQLLTQHCDAARYVWNLAVEQHSHWQPGRTSGPAWSEQCRQLTHARAEHEWLAAGNVDVQQQALKDFAHARNAFFQSGFGEPTWRKKYRHEGFRVIGNGRTPAYQQDGTPELNRKGKQVMHRQMAVQKLNRRWAQVKIPAAGWVRFRLTRKHLPDAKTCRVTWKNNQWHVAFAIKPDPVEQPGNSQTAGVDRGVAVTAALHDGTLLNCPQPSNREQAARRKHERRAARAPKRSQRKADEYAKANKLKAREANVRKDWCEKTSTMLARGYDEVRFEKLHIKNMTRSAKGTVEQPGRNVKAKSGSNRSILAQGWGLLRSRTEHKAPGRTVDVPAPYTSLRCSGCGWIDKNSRKNQAEFVCSACGFQVNADTNAAINVAARRASGSYPGALSGSSCAGGATPPSGGSSAREPQPV